MDKGYSEKEACEKAKKVIFDVSSKGLYNQLKSKDKKSKLEILVGKELANYYDITIDSVAGKYFPDFFIKELDCYVEVFGDYWHKNPEIYNEENKQWDYDEARINEIKKITSKKVIVLWEKEIKDFGIKNIKELVEKKVNEDN